MTRLTRPGVLACALAVTLAGVVYVPALHNPFIYDDHLQIVDNRAIADLSDLRTVVWDNVTRPLVNISYAVDRRVSGTSPFGFHLTNVLLHVLNTVLFAWFTWRLASRPGRDRPEVVAPFAALLFAVHPMLTEAVGYISGRSELLCATFLLLALHAARRALLTERVAPAMLAIVFWIAALASKETAVLFPVLVFLCDRLFPADDPAGAGRRLWRLHVPLLAIAVALAAVRLGVFVWIEHGRRVAPEWGLVWVELVVILRYVTMLVWPAGQAIFHAVAPVGPTSPSVWAAAGVIVVLAGVAWAARHSRPFVSYGLAWFFLLLLPSGVLVMLDRGEPMAEHRVYIAALGLFLAAASLVDRFTAWLAMRGASARIVVAAAFVAVALSLGGRTILRNQIWSDPLVVWLEAAERAPEHWFPALMLGEELHRRGRHEDAVAAYRRAIAARPQEPAPHGKLGVCRAELHDLVEAEASFARQRALDPTSAEASNGLATVALLRGDLSTAKRGYLGTLALDPGNVAARRGLAGIEEAPGGSPAEALRWCEDIKRLAPETPGNDECIRRNQARVAGSNTSGS